MVSKGTEDRPQSQVIDIFFISYKKLHNMVPLPCSQPAGSSCYIDILEQPLKTLTPNPYVHALPLPLLSV